MADIADVATALDDGSAQRATSATAMNASSSRSHAVLSVRVSPANAGGRASLLHLVDLAGEEDFPLCSAWKAFWSLRLGLTCLTPCATCPLAPSAMLLSWAKLAAMQGPMP